MTISDKINEMRQRGFNQCQPQGWEKWTQPWDFLRGTLKKWRL